MGGGWWVKKFSLRVVVVIVAGRRTTKLKMVFWRSEKIMASDDGGQAKRE